MFCLHTQPRENKYCTEREGKKAAISAVFADRGYMLMLEPIPVKKGVCILFTFPLSSWKIYFFILILQYVNVFPEVGVCVHCKVYIQ